MDTFSIKSNILKFIFYLMLLEFLSTFYKIHRCAVTTVIKLKKKIVREKHVLLVEKPAIVTFNTIIYTYN